MKKKVVSEVQVVGARSARRPMIEVWEVDLSRMSPAKSTSVPRCLRSADSREHVPVFPEWLYVGPGGI